MGIITLTDRISVRVSAKNDMQSNDYKKATGGAIASKLGNGNVSDSLKSQLGNTKNPTITDENGDTWVSMEDMIDAGKAMNGDGAFEETTSYRYGNVACVNIYDFPIYSEWGSQNQFWAKGPCWIDSVYGDCGWNFNSTMPEDTQAAIVKKVNEDKWYLLMISPSGSYINFQASFESGAGGAYYNQSQINIDNHTILEGLIPITEVGEVLSLSQYGDLHEETTGGSSYDWTKSDAEIEEDIRDQEEVWDVVQNAVSSSSSTAKIPVGPYVNVGHIDDSWDSGSGGGHTGGDF